MISSLHKCGLQRFMVFIVMLEFTLAGCSQKKPTADVGPQKAALTVGLVSPQRDNWPRHISASGNVQAWQEASIGAELSGLKLDHVDANVGDKVRRGQLLAHFNEESVRNDGAQQNAAVAEALANVTKARTDYERAIQLENTGAISKQDILQYHNTLQTSEAKLASARAQQAAQALRLRYTRVLAPAHGIISSRTATVGAVVAGGSELFKMIIGGRLEWRAEVPSDKMALLHNGQSVQIEVLDSGSKDARITGTIRQIAPTVSTDTRNGMIYVDIPYLQQQPLKAGMFVSGNIFLSSQPAVYVPESAIVVRDGYSYVMKVDANNHIHQVKVQTGRRQGNAVEVLKGTQPEDKLVLSGGSFLIEGDTVKVVKEAGSAS